MVHDTEEYASSQKDVAKGRKYAHWHESEEWQNGRQCRHVPLEK